MNHKKVFLKLSTGFVAILVLLFAVCCWDSTHKKSNVREVVVYTSWDKPHSQLILDEFEKSSGIKVKAVYDTEASKTAGLVNRLIAERKNPVADVFWNSEIVRTLVLKERGVLAAYKPPAWDKTPESFRNKEGYWTGFGGRSRVLLYNTDLIEEPPIRLADLANPEWRGKFAMANPLFGTTATEVSTWYSEWGSEKAEAFLQSLIANDVLITTGNATAKDMVAVGEVPICLTDTDDALGAISNGKPVAIVFLDQGYDGALLIPSTVCLIKGARHEAEAKELIDYLTSPEVEAMLAKSRAGQIPLKKEVSVPEPISDWMQMDFRSVDFEAAHAELDPAMQFVREVFLR